MKKVFGIKGQFIFLFAFILIFSFGIGSFTWISLNTQSNTASANLSKLDNYIQLVDASREIQVDFKKQVQSWKDILLRGLNPEAFKKYYKEFSDYDEAVSIGLVNLKEEMSKYGMNTALIDKSLDEHKGLHDKYINALKQFNYNNKDSYSIVDNLVKGMDRAPTNDMDLIVKAIRDKANIDMKYVKVQEHKSNVNLKFELCIILGAGILLLFLICFIILKTYKNIERFILQLHDLIISIGEGDLTKKGVVHTNDEFGILINKFNDFIEKIKAMIFETQKMSVAVVTASKGVMEVSDDANKVSEQISIAMNEMAEGATNQSSLTQHGSEMVSDVARELSKVTESTNDMINLAMKTEKIVEDGINIIKYQNERIHYTKDTSVEVSNSILNLSSKSNKIKEFAKVINDIAEQTNLLALNASIESARAGEFGKGFAVVANEIRKLAELTNDSTKQIEELINGIQSGVNDTIDKMNIATTSIDEEIISLDKTHYVFEEIKESVKNVNSRIDDIASRTGIIGVNTINVENSIKNIVSIIEQNAAGTQEVAASTETQVGHMREIILAARELSMVSKNLNVLLSNFKVE